MSNCPPKHHLQTLFSLKTTNEALAQFVCINPNTSHYVELKLHHLLEMIVGPYIIRPNVMIRNQRFQFCYLFYLILVAIVDLLLKVNVNSS